MAKSKLEEALEKYLTGNLELRAGIFETAKYPDGTPVAHVAYINEYGATIEQQARTGTIYRRLKKDGSFARGGKFVKAKSSNFATQHDIAEHTINIPPRPFFRKVVNDGKSTWSAILAASIKQDKGDIRKSLARLGKIIDNELKASVLAWSDPPNAKSTIAQKGFNKPLVDDGDLSKSFEYEVIDDQG